MYTHRYGVWTSCRTTWSRDPLVLNPDEAVVTVGRGGVAMVPVSRATHLRQSGAQMPSLRHGRRSSLYSSAQKLQTASYTAGVAAANSAGARLVNDRPRLWTSGPGGVNPLRAKSVWRSCHPWTLKGATKSSVWLHTRRRAHRCHTCGATCTSRGPANLPCIASSTPNAMVRKRSMSLADAFPVSSIRRH